MASYLEQISTTFTILSSKELANQSMTRLHTWATGTARAVHLMLNSRADKTRAALSLHRISLSMATLMWSGRMSFCGMSSVAIFVSESSFVRIIAWSSATLKPTLHRLVDTNMNVQCQCSCTRFFSRSFATFCRRWGMLMTTTGVDASILPMLAYSETNSETRTRS